MIKLWSVWMSRSFIIKENSKYVFGGIIVLVGY